VIKKEQILTYLNDGDPSHWLIYLMDFVDDFRRQKDIKALAESFEYSKGLIRCSLRRPSIYVTSWASNRRIGY
jgi:hypothetical protein